MPEPPFHVLVRRYFLFGWLFRDVRRGHALERAAAWRHNREQARWLTTYLRRWLVVALLTYGLGAVCELYLHAPLLSAFFFVPSAVSISVNTVIGALIVGLKVLSGPL
ncbi:MAG: hypothetical protein ACTHL1_03870 [Burkholderiaceae bacterium]